ncbi:MAG: hypothetical protein ACRDZO_20470 [Egibacteraceae bacterium]
MSAGVPHRIEYIEARRVLLDALEGLADHLDALVLVGAQAVYFRTEGRLPAYQPFTTDADLVVDPHRLAPEPPIDTAMRRAGFKLRAEDTGTPEPGVWESRFCRPGEIDEIVVPVDLIVPERVAAPGGRRDARLPRSHGKRVARKSAGLEGSLVDHDPLEIAALEAGDGRHFVINVAGVGALLVAKIHKISDRLGNTDRLVDKDAGDIYRLFTAASPGAMAAIVHQLLDDVRSAHVTRAALEHCQTLFTTPRSQGTVMAVAALRGLQPADTVISVCTGYARALLRELR